MSDLPPNHVRLDLTFDQFQFVAVAVARGIGGLDAPTFPEVMAGVLAQKLAFQKLSKKEFDEMKKMFKQLNEVARG